MTLHPAILYGAFPLAGYAVGSVPFGVLIARSRGVDLRKAGSGNVGATNVGRVLGRKWGYLCFLLDFAKGFLPALAAGLVLRGQPDFYEGAAPAGGYQAAWLAAGCGAILGHVFSVWLRFRGGKGVATSLGAVVGVWPYLTLPGLAALGLWILVTLTSRYVSLGSIVAAAAFVPLLAGFAAVLGWGTAGLWPFMAFGGAMAGLILLRHRANIRRLLAGRENRIGVR